MENKSGYIYILVNPSLPGILKIGRTTKNPLERLKDLSSQSGVPTPFQLAYYKPTADCFEAEKWMHSKFEHRRVSDNREFFHVSLYEAAVWLDQITGTLSSFDPPTPYAEFFNTLPTRPDGKLNEDEIRRLRKFEKKLNGHI